MSSDPPDRASRILVLLGEMGQVSALSVLFSQAVADRVGMHPTDLESLDILRRYGPLTAGRLAELTGLSTGGAITKLIDRLEQRGFVRREADPSDRRRVIVRTLDQAERELEPFYAGLVQGLERVIADFTDEEIGTILDFTVQSNRILAKQIDNVRGIAETPTVGARTLPKSVVTPAAEAG